MSAKKGDTYGTITGEADAEAAAEREAVVRRLIDAQASALIDAMNDVNAQADAIGTEWLDTPNDACMTTLGLAMQLQDLRGRYGSAAQDYAAAVYRGETTGDAPPPSEAFGWADQMAQLAHERFWATFP